MNKLTTITLMVILSVALTGCFDSSSEQAAPAAIIIPTPPPTGVTANGKIYYQSNCAACHQAGADDTTSAFSAIDLAQNQDKIATDMSTFDGTSGFNLMGAYSNVPAQRVADLKVYFASIPVI